MLLKYVFKYFKYFKNMFAIVYQIYLQYFGEEPFINYGIKNPFTLKYWEFKWIYQSLATVSVHRCTVMNNNIVSTKQCHQSTASNTFRVLWNITTALSVIKMHLCSAGLVLCHGARVYSFSCLNCNWMNNLWHFYEKGICF